MVSPNQLRSWSPARMREISDTLNSRRRSILHQSDELDYGRMPTSYTFESAHSALAAHRRLADALAAQTAEIGTVIDALDGATERVDRAKRYLDAAYDAASGDCIAINGQTGAVYLTRTFEKVADYIAAQRRADGVRSLVRQALTAAAGADTDLAAVIEAATDADPMGTRPLAEQRIGADFEALPPSERIDYLRQNPTTFEFLSDAQRTRLGDLAGEELARLAQDPRSLNDLATIDRFSSFLDVIENDTTTTAAMYDRLGADGLLTVLGGVENGMELRHREELTDLAQDLRTGLQTATRDRGFDGEQFGRELAELATIDDPRTYDGPFDLGAAGRAGVLDFLLRKGSYDENFVRGVTWQLDEFERAEPGRAVLWASQADNTQLSFVDARTGAIGVHPDPMASAMNQLADHPQLGLEFFSETEHVPPTTAGGQAGELRIGADRVAYYAGERDWSTDGFAGIANAALAIGTDPANVSADQKAVSDFVSGYCDNIAENKSFTYHFAEQAAQPTAKLMAEYLPAVQKAAIAGADDVVNTAGNQQEHQTVRSTAYPTFDRPDLSAVLKVAVSTNEGKVILAAAVAQDRYEQLSHCAAQNQGLPLDPTAKNSDVSGVLRYTAGGDALVHKAIWDVATDKSIVEDQQAAQFLKLMSLATSKVGIPLDGVGEALGDIPKGVMNMAQNDVKSSLISDLTSEWLSTGHTAATTAQANISTDVGLEGLVARSYQDLVRIGMIEVPPEYEHVWYEPDGSLCNVIDVDPKTTRWLDLVASAKHELSQYVNETDIEKAVQDVYHKARH